MRISLKNIIVPSIPLAVLLVSGCVALWFSFRIFQLPQTYAESAPSFIESIIPVGSFWSDMLSLLMAVFNAFLIAQINNRFTVIRTRTFMPVLVFLFLMASWSKVHVVNGSQLILTLVILSLFYFFTMARDRNATEPAFMGSLLLSVGSFFLHPLLFLIPICWLGFLAFQSFSLRTFLASVFGALAPWILYLSASYLLSNKIDLRMMNDLIPHTDFLGLMKLPFSVLVYGAVFFALFLIGVLGMYSFSNGDSIHTRNKLNFLMIIAVAVFVLSILFMNYFLLFLPLIAFVFSLLISHPFTLGQTNFYGFVFLIFCALNIAFVVSNYLLF